MKYISTLFMFAGLFLALPLFAQPPAEFLDDGNGGIVMPNDSSLTAYLNFFPYPPPSNNMEDYVAAVDGDDASVILGYSVVGQGLLANELIGAPFINEPTGNSNTVHFVYYDGSEMTFAIVNDENGDPITAPYEISDDPSQPSSLNNYELPTGAMAFPGSGEPVMPGESDFGSVVTQLPVELTAFTGNASKKGVSLNWATETESGNDYFTVERADKAGVFSAIGMISGSGDAPTGADYEYFDETPNQGNNYYRLIQTDLDGTVNDLNAIVVVGFNTGAQAEFSVYPNPATSELNIQLDQAWGEAPVRAALYNAAGQQVVAWMVNPASVTTESVANLPVGIYQLRVQNDDQTVSTRVVIK